MRYLSFRNYGAKIILLLTLFGLLPSPLFAFQNEPDDFRGIKWGTNISKLSGMMLIENGGDAKYYKRKNDKMKIGDADIDTLVYGFYKGRFYIVQIYFKYFLNFSKIQETFFQSYGVGYRSNEFIEDYFWNGSNVQVNLKYNEALEKGKILYFFMPIVDEEKADEKAKAKKGAEDL